MSLGNRRHVPRCLFVWAIGTAALAGAALTAGPAAAEARTTVRTGTLDLLPFDRALRDLAATVAVACAVWAWLTLTVTVVDAARRRGHAVGRGGARCRVPLGVRGVVLAACGVAVVSTSAPPALADDDASGAVHGASGLSGLPLPDRAVAPTRSTSSRSHPGTSPHIVVVSPGDTLWSIAADELPADASDQLITAGWHKLYAANRDRIGPDPDVIEPGQRLDLPPERPPREDRT